LIEYVVQTSGECGEDESEEEENETAFVIPYGITGLVDKKTVLQCGEKVNNKHLQS
jgi:hypothetical protein